MSGRPDPRFAPSLPLPARPFVPGTGMPRPQLALAPLRPDATPDAPEALAHFRFGGDLFNGGFWWEAHECWEQPWRAAVRGSARRLLLQGLIFWAAGHLQWSRGRIQGGEWHLERALARLREGLARAGPQAAAQWLCGLDVGRHLPAWQAWSQPPLATLDREQILARMPRLHLPAAPAD